MTEAKKFNSRKGSKKFSILLVLYVLDCWSSRERPIKQSQIVDFINNCEHHLGTEVWCDRKTVGRHIKTLQQVGYSVEHIKGKGWYLENGEFDAAECDTLADVVAQSSLPELSKQSFMARLAFRKAFVLKYKK